MDKNILRDRIRGALYAHAIGDAMGATTEFMSAEEIKIKYGRVDDLIGGGWLDLKVGETTDDTAMTIGVIDALMSVFKSGDEFKKYCADNFLAWFETGPKDVGNQCQIALVKYKMTGDYIDEDKDALGNGSLMRALPCAFLPVDVWSLVTDRPPADEPSLVDGRSLMNACPPVDLAFYLNLLQGEITHRNKTCADILTTYTKIIRHFISGENYKLKSQELLKPSGYIINTYNNAKHFANLPVADAIIGAVNHGGDADTIAAITGSMAGARDGYHSIPKEWIDKLDANVKAKYDSFIEFLLEKYE
ncbi:ADP-ribosylglycohydrolase family protein [Ezakiella peruensis]|uniref:ADP-ribosylglycohydrolase family protein n=1 Tax=Ezakiella peruensis TaxID=1464038 RepID=UPI000C1B14F8|nr:ADP-ribosylglycohydrolase family protein [Ezakiella peruensis]